MPAPLVRARLLGTLDLCVGDERLAPFESARLESLLAYLLLHRDAPQPRHRLAFVLWPDSTEQQAQTNLRKVLHNLRRALPDADQLIEVTPRTLRWRGPVSVDVEEFERALAEGRFEEAVGAYAGELLEGRYDEWVLDERDRLAGLYLNALERLARQREHDRRWPDAIRAAERLVAGDPLREESHRLLIRLCHAAGDRARALRAYHVCASTLERALEIEPSPATRALYEEIVDAAPDVTASGGRVPFIGRAGEVARLRLLWRGAMGGRAQIVLVTGEAGVGKTRLVDELRAQTSAVAVEARAYPAGGPVAYGLATAWLRSQPIATRLTRLERPLLIELARVLPELAAQVPPPQPVSAPELRRRLFGAIARALLLSEAPLLLIADDAHWGDTQSLHFLHYLLRSAPSARMLIACTARREELDDDHPLPALIRATQGLGRFSEIALDRLDRDETALLAERITGARLEANELGRLYDYSEGNPLFVVEALQPDAPAAASKVQAVLAGRLASLSPHAAGLAGLAAAVGRAFTADVLVAASGLEEVPFVVALDELWRRGIVRAHGPNAYDFTHGRIRDSAYAGLSPPRRRQVHLAIARALEQTPGAPGAAVASHYDNAGATPEAIRWYERAAEDAQWLHAHGEAVHALEQALRLSDALPAGEDTARLQLRLLTALLAPLMTREGYGSQLEWIHERALRLIEQLGDEPDPVLVWSLALAVVTRGDWETADMLGERLRTRAERDRDEAMSVQSNYIQGIAAYWPGNLERARKHFEAAMEHFEPRHRRAHVLRYAQDPELVVRLRLAHTLWLLGHADESERQRERALAALPHSTHPYSHAVLWVFSAVLALDRGDIEELRRDVQALEAHGADDAPAQVRVPIELFAGYLEVLDGGAGPGLARMRAVREQVAHSPSPAPGLPGLTTRVLLEGYALAGEAELGLALADEALGMGRGAALWEAEIRRLRATFLASAGASDDEVAAELERALAVARRQRARAFEERIQGTLAERRLSHHGAL